MKANHSAMIQPTTMTVISGLTIVVAATWALGSMEQDQSGQSIAVVSSSFRTESGIRRNGFEPIPVGQIDGWDTPPVRSRSSQSLAVTLGEAKEDVDPAQIFASLMSELERIAGNRRSETPVHAVELNIKDRDPEYAISVIRSIHGSLDHAGFLTTAEKLRLEIQTWAASPTQKAWIDAVQDASRLQHEIDRGLSDAKLLHITTKSSAALWPYPTQVRPALTIVVQVPVR